jgi:hypothetical protein
VEGKMPIRGYRSETEQEKKHKGRSSENISSTARILNFLDEATHGML